LIIVDTSIWVHHFRRPSKRLVAILGDNIVAVHPFILGELLLGGVASDAIEQLMTIVKAPLASAGEVNRFIWTAGLAGTGIGYVDSHLLASARLMRGGRVITADKRLHKQAARLQIVFE
jgi:predicted nucleic acid-binding protein